LKRFTYKITATEARIVEPAGISVTDNTSLPADFGKFFELITIPVTTGFKSAPIGMEGVLYPSVQLLVASKDGAINWTATLQGSNLEGTDDDIFVDVITTPVSVADALGSTLLFPTNLIKNFKYMRVKISAVAGSGTGYLIGHGVGNA
jgi:hypothetical protein